MTPEQLQLLQAIETMPDDDRIVFTRARFDGLDLVDIAAELAINIGEVEDRLGRAMLHLVQAMAKD